VWIAGGIGITPFLAWLESLRGNPRDCPDVALHYCVRQTLRRHLCRALRELCDGSRVSS
jgi:predicted ferric reductase